MCLHQGMIRQKYLGADRVNQQREQKTHTNKTNKQVLLSLFHLEN